MFCVTFQEQDLDLGYSLVEPWKRKVTSNSVPYFLNTSTRVTQWDHPLLQMHMKNIHEKTQEVPGLYFLKILVTNSLDTANQSFRRHGRIFNFDFVNGFSVNEL